METGFSNLSGGGAISEPIDQLPGLVYVFIYYIIFYIIGSIPFGLLLTKIFEKKDLRTIGSGNIGATNVLRTGNKKLAFATLFLDFLKGGGLIFLLLLFGGTFSQENKFESHDFALILSVGFAAILGHCYPVWLKFKGGKGVATTFGVLIAAVPWAGFFAVCTWGIVAGFFRYSSLSAMCAVAIAPLATFLIYGAMPAGITLLIAALVIWRHKDNIKRLTAGTEPKIFEKKETADEPAASKH